MCNDRLVMYGAGESRVVNGEKNVEEGNRTVRFSTGKSWTG